MSNSLSSMIMQNLVKRSENNYKGDRSEYKMNIDSKEKEMLRKIMNNDVKNNTVNTCEIKPFITDKKIIYSLDDFINKNI